MNAPDNGAFRMMRIIRQLKDRLGIHHIGGEPIEQLVRRWSRVETPELRLEVRPYDPAWPVLFERERQRLQEALAGEPLVDIQHVGSTSIPPLPSKNVLDLAVALHPPLCTTRQRELLESLGYRFHGTSPIDPSFFWFWRIEEAGALVVHLCDPKAAWYTNLLHFRDYMREHPAEREEYERLKRELASTHGHSWLEYSVLKRHLLQQLTERANAWVAARNGAC
ncbi:GrpB family protein [Archangium minus]